MTQHSQFALLGKRRFLPFFITQLLGVFNDNIFKQSLILAVLYHLSVSSDRSLLVNLCVLLFILPFFLFSALGGQFGEKYSKGTLVRAPKLAEVNIMLVGAAGFVFGSLPLVFTALFVTGTHSALFGPVKYSILPQHLHEDKLVGSNALVEMDIFLAVLVGTIGAGVLMSYAHYATTVTTAVVLVATCGYPASCGIPRVAAALPGLKLDWNIFAQSWGILRLGLGQRPAVLRSLVSNPQFWFLDAIYLTQIPTFAEEWLYDDESVVTLILTMFSVGIVLGSMLCEELSGCKVEIGLVPFDSIDLTVFDILLWWHVSDIPPDEAPYDWLAVLCRHETWAVLTDILFIGIFGGFYIVPLYALIQARADEDKRARVTAANNILNTLFMAAAALVSILLLSVTGLSILQLFLALPLMNVAINVYIFKIVPEFIMRFLVWLFSHAMHRVQHMDLETIPDEGVAVLVCNHVSYVDALLIIGSIRRLARFVMYYRIFSLPVLNFVFHTAGAVPIAVRHKDEGIYERAFQRIADYLRDGGLVCVFPEDKLTADDEISEFRAGVERTIEGTPVPVTPMALQDLWGNFFSRDPNRDFLHRLWSRVSLVAGESMAPGTVGRPDLQARVTSLRGEAR